MYPEDYSKGFLLFSISLSGHACASSDAYPDLRKRTFELAALAFLGTCRDDRAKVGVVGVQAGSKAHG